MCADDVHEDGQEDQESRNGERHYALCTFKWLIGAESREPDAKERQEEIPEDVKDARPSPASIDEAHDGSSRRAFYWADQDWLGVVFER